MNSSALKRKAGFVLLKILLTTGLLLAMAWKFDFLAALQMLSTITWSTVGACVALLLGQTWISGMRLSTVVSMFGARLSNMRAARLTLQATFINQAFISFVGGDAFKVWRIHSADVPLSQATSSVVLDRVVGFMANHIVFVALLPWIIWRIESAAIRMTLLALAGGGLGGIGLVFGLGLLGRRTPPMYLLPERLRQSRAALMIIELTTIGRHMLANPAVSWRICWLGVVLSLMNCLIFYLILRDWGVLAGIAFYCSLLVPGVMEIALLPVSVAGWGLRESAAVVCFVAVGLSSETGLAVSTAFGLLSLAVALPGGLLWLAERPSRTQSTEK